MAEFMRWRNEVVSSEITRNRLDGSPEDQADAVADLIARVLAGEEV